MNKAMPLKMRLNAMYGKFDSTDPRKHRRIMTSTLTFRGGRFGYGFWHFVKGKAVTSGYSII